MTINNVSVFSQAFAGAQAGMAASGRVPQNAPASVYQTLSGVSGAFASAIDAAWGVASPTSLVLGVLFSACYGVWAERGASLTASQDPSTYAAEAASIVAQASAASSYFTAHGIPQSFAPSGSLPALGDVQVDPLDATKNLVVNLERFPVTAPQVGVDEESALWFESDGMGGGKWNPVPTLGCLITNPGDPIPDVVPQLGDPKKNSLKHLNNVPITALPTAFSPVSDYDSLAYVPVGDGTRHLSPVYYGDPWKLNSNTTLNAGTTNAIFVPNFKIATGMGQTTNLGMGLQGFMTVVDTAAGRSFCQNFCAAFFRDGAGVSAQRGTTTYGNPSGDVATLGTSTLTFGFTGAQVLQATLTPPAGYVGTLNWRVFVQPFMNPYVAF